MDKEKLISIIESLLFINGEPLSITEIAQGLKLEELLVNAACEELVERYERAKGGIKIIRLNGRIQMCTNPKNDQAIADFFQPIKKASLSTSALETLSIIAYRQPITRTEIEDIRRVQCSYVLKYLHSHGLIQVVGKKKTLGNPSLYGTTDEFLRMLGISSLAELPELKGEETT